MGLGLESSGAGGPLAGASGGGGCRMVRGTGSSLIPGSGEKAGTDGYIFSVGAGWGGDKGGGIALGPPRKASSGEFIVT